MFESRLQYVQLAIFAGGIATLVGILVLIKGPIVVGIFFLVLGNALAAVGNALYANMKGYPAFIGVGIGIPFGVIGSIFVHILPDQTEESPYEQERRLVQWAAKKAKRKRKDPGYEVLDED